ncbi:MAG TPA: cation:dicarboxylase symporter family transporter [Sphaerochaeta sp.]|nr:cation:dicarboxylase symporter family transporter [Sphaerochaeta sp.]
MKTWISYLAATALGLAATLLFGESLAFTQTMLTFTAFFVQVGGFLLIPLAFVGFSSGVASLRKDAKGGVLTRTTIIWSILSTLLLAFAGAAVFRFFPVNFPASSSAGGNPQMLAGLIPHSFLQLLPQGMASNPFYTLVRIDGFLLPLLLVALFFGYFLKPNMEVIRPAYVTMNSFSEVMFRMARAYSAAGFLFVFFAAGYWFSHMQMEGTLFVATQFLLTLIGATLGVLLILLPLLLAIVSGFRVNPYKILIRMLAPAIAGLFTANIFFTTPMTMSLSRHNAGAQKRVSGTAVPLYTIIGRGGSAMIASFSTLSLVYAASGELPGLQVLVAVAAASAALAYLSPLYLGMEVFFISLATLQVLEVSLYGAEMTLIAMIPLLNGLGVLIDSYIAAFGAAYTTERMGVRIENSYRDIV